MHAFAALYLALDATNSTDDKTALVAAYFTHADDADAGVALSLLTGNRLKRMPPSKLLRDLAAETAGLPVWLVDVSRESVGDLSETVSLLLPRRDDGVRMDASLAETWRERIAPLSGADAATQRHILLDAFAVLPAEDRLVYLKLVRGGFRVGVQRKTVVRALARATGLDVDLLAHRLTGATEPTAEAYRAVIDPDDAAELARRPYPFFLARAPDPTDETFPAKLGDRSEWRAEWKYDGIRAQLIRRSGQTGIETALWSRGEELITHQFPEIITQANELPNGVVLDGEVLAWAGDRPAPFAELQTRLNRKVAPTAQPGLFDEERVVFTAYDVLELDGADLRSEPLRARFARLAELIPEPDRPGMLRRTVEVDAGDWDALAAQRERSRELGVEGVMLKHLDSVYGVGRRAADDTGGWWKWKIDPFSVDAVLVAAQPGSGRRAGLYTDYTFAVWDREEREPRRALVTFAKAYSGLTQEEIERVDAFVRAHTTERHGPVRIVSPELVFELHFEGIARSGRHKSGYAVRFPRMARWRTDKRADDADTVATLERLAGGVAT